MSIGNVRRSTPNQRPPVLFLDTTVGVDTFKFSEGFCEGRSVSADKVEMRLYLAGCEPEVFVRRQSCTCRGEGVCDFCSSWEWPRELQKPNDRGGWPPRYASVARHGQAEAVRLPALEILPGGQVSFQYDSVVHDFIAKYYTRQLTGIFLMDCHPAGYVRFLTDPRIKPTHVAREVNLIAFCQNEAPPKNEHKVREQCTTPTASKDCCDPVEDFNPYTHEFTWRDKKC